ncbi:cytochrome-b5 reductase [Martiniozyma asiatica (nom. inval.)]|nr:cytochrome-b5 reductase [Martiniozyma asiatica]
MSRFAKFALPVVAAAGGYMYLSSQLVAPAVPVLTGDGQWVDIKVASVKTVSDDTKLLSFALPESNNVLGLTTASCILTKFVTPKGSNVIRPYTPISDNDERGQFEMLVKKYEGGKMSGHIHNLQPGDVLAFKGPILKWKWQANQYKHVGLIAGGTGIAPMYQVIRESLKDSNDNTKFTLLYGSKTPADILLKDELDTFAKAYPEKFEVKYFVDSKGNNVDFIGTEGFITKEVLENNMPKPAEDTHVFVCGPPPMYKAISGPKKGPTDQGEVEGLLKDLGYDKNTVFKF